MSQRGAWGAGAALAIVILLALPGAPGMAPSAPHPGIDTPLHSQALRTYRVVGYNSSVDGTNLTYLEWLPAGYNSSKSYPLAVFLHGLGYDGNELLLLASGLASIQNASTYQFLLISINTRTLSGFYVNSPYSGPQEQDVLDAITHEESIRKVTTSELFLFGSSMGTIGSYSIAAHHPGLVRGIGAVAECPEVFMASYYHYLIGQQDAFLTTTNGLLPNQSAQALSEIYYLDAVRYYPTNFSNVLLYAVQGGNDNRCPNNPHIFGYQQSNNTYLNSTCLIVRNWSQPASCQTPFANLSSANPGQYLWRYDYEPTGQHTLNDLAPADMFLFWLGQLPTGLYCGVPGDTPFSCVYAPQVPAPTASPPTVDVNATLTLHASPFGGAPPYTYYWRGLPRGCTSVNSSTIRCSPTTPGSFNVSTLVVDANASDGLSPTTLVVVNPAFSARASGSPLVGPAPLIVNFTSTYRGGTLPVSIRWMFGDGNESSLTNVSHSFATPGTYSSQVWINDSGGSAYSTNLTIAVGPLPLLVTAPTASSRSADIGQTILFQVTAAGGTGAYSFNWIGLPFGCPSSNATTVSCTPAAAGPFSIQVTVHDALGAGATSPALGFQVYAPPVTTGLSMSRSVADVAQSITISFTVVGGAPPLTTVWVGLPTGCSSENVSVLTCVPSGPGNFSLSAQSTDANGLAAHSELASITVFAAPRITQLTGSPDPPVAGKSWTLAAELQGGAPPISWTYDGLPSGCASVNSSTFTCTPSQTGTFRVQATATDGAGVQAIANLSLNVTAGSTGFGPFANPGQFLLDMFTGAVVVGLIIVSILLVVLWRSTRTPSPRTDTRPGDEPEPGTR